jgi:hypothetical protein
MKGRFAASVLVLALVFSGCDVPERAEAPIPKTDEVFYIENPALKLSDLAGHITDITDPNDDYAIILGYSEYPLVIRKDRGVHPYITLNSEGTEFIMHNICLSIRRNAETGFRERCRKICYFQRHGGFYLFR